MKKDDKILAVVVAITMTLGILLAGFFVGVAIDRNEEEKNEAIEVCENHGMEYLERKTNGLGKHTEVWCWDDTNRTVIRLG